MNEVDMTKIKEYFEENLFEPDKNWPKDAFEERSYARWAAMELWGRLLDHPYEQADDIIFEFILDMIHLESYTSNPKRVRIFSIARETAEDILTLF